MLSELQRGLYEEEVRELREEGYVGVEGEYGVVDFLCGWIEGEEVWGVEDGGGEGGDGEGRGGENLLDIRIEEGEGEREDGGWEEVKV